MAIHRTLPASNKVKSKTTRQRKEMLKFLLEHAREFCDKSSLHGLRYVTEKGAHWLQSAVWAAFIILGSIFCVILMFLLWDRFSHNPTITAVETINYPVWNVPFPAITICDANKVYRPNVQKVKDILLSNRVSEAEADEFFASLSYLINIHHTSGTFPEIFTILDNIGMSVESLMLEVMPRCRELLKKCTWMGDELPCWKLFKTIKTDDGFCCSFNYHHTNESFDRFDESYAPEHGDTEYYTAGAGTHTGLNVVIQVDAGEYISSTRLVPSVIVLVHENSDYPEIRTLGTLIQRGELIHIPVEPSVIDTSEDVKTIHYTKRNCTFDGEESISIGTYGYENCIIECRMDAIAQLCGCIPFYYNRKYYKNLLYTLQEDSSTDNTSFGLKCRCYPKCNINWYTSSVDMGDKVDIESENYNISNIISMHIYFIEFSCLKYKQSNLITWDGLFASFGGIFGLCLGGSVLSIMEIIYHFTIKLYMSFKKNKDTIRKISFLKWKKMVFFNNSVQASKLFSQNEKKHNQIFYLTKQTSKYCQSKKFEKPLFYISNPYGNN